jgi:hypothetical protein
MSISCQLSWQHLIEGYLYSLCKSTMHFSNWDMPPSLFSSSDYHSLTRINRGKQKSCTDGEQITEVKKEKGSKITHLHL